MKICALIPVYNNASTIEDVVSRCRTVIEPDVFVVADGSTDESDEIARKAGACIFTIPYNKGKGHAILHGLKELQFLGYSHAIVLDADGQHLPEDIPAIVDSVWENPDSIWVGVRKMTSDSVPPSSRRDRFFSNFWTTLNGWQRCHDAQSGFRCYPIDKILDLKCLETGFAFEMEVLIRASWAGIRICHLEIEVIYSQNEQDRISFYDPVKDKRRDKWLNFKMFWTMLLTSPILVYKKISKY